MLLPISINHGGHTPGGPWPPGVNVEFVNLRYIYIINSDGCVYLVCHIGLETMYFVLFKFNVSLLLLIQLLTFTNSLFRVVVKFIICPCK